MSMNESRNIASTSIWAPSRWASTRRRRDIAHGGSAASVCQPLGSSSRTRSGASGVTGGGGVPVSAMIWAARESAAHPAQTSRRRPGWGTGSPAAASALRRVNPPTTMPPGRSSRSRCKADPDSTSSCNSRHRPVRQPTSAWRPTRRGAAARSGKLRSRVTMPSVTVSDSRALSSTVMAPASAVRTSRARPLTSIGPSGPSGRVRSRLVVRRTPPARRGGEPGRGPGSPLCATVSLTIPRGYAARPPPAHGLSTADTTAGASCRTRDRLRVWHDATRRGST